MNKQNNKTKLEFRNKWFVRRKIFSDEQKKKNHKQSKQQTKLDSRLANGFRQDTDTKGITSSLIKDDRC